MTNYAYSTQGDRVSECVWERERERKIVIENRTKIKPHCSVNRPKSYYNPLTQTEYNAIYVYYWIAWEALMLFSEQTWASSMCWWWVCSVFCSIYLHSTRIFSLMYCRNDNAWQAENKTSTDFSFIQLHYLFFFSSSLSLIALIQYGRIAVRMLYRSIRWFRLKAFLANLNTALLLHRRGQQFDAIQLSCAEMYAFNSLYWQQIGPNSTLTLTITKSQFAEFRFCGASEFCISIRGISRSAWLQVSSYITMIALNIGVVIQKQCLNIEQKSHLCLYSIALQKQRLPEWNTADAN